jgi:hypothetical protein
MKQITMSSFSTRFNYYQVAVGLLVLLSLSSPSMAGMRWSARAVDPSLIDAIRGDRKLLKETLFGEQLHDSAEHEKCTQDENSPVRVCFIDLWDKQYGKELEAWSKKRKAEVGDTEVDLDEAWHGIHYLLTGSVLPNDTLASKVIMSGEEIGPDHGYGPAMLLKPDEVRAIAQLLQETTPDMLRKRFDPMEMARAGVYPGIWVKLDRKQTLGFLLNYYRDLVAFYRRAAKRGQAVIHVLS